MKKKVEELKELVSEDEDVYRQVVAAKAHVSTRLQRCWDCLQKTQDSLLTVRGSEAATVLTKLKVRSATKSDKMVCAIGPGRLQSVNKQVSLFSVYLKALTQLFLLAPNVYFSLVPPGTCKALFVHRGEAGSRDKCLNKHLHLAHNQTPSLLAQLSYFTP